MKINADKMHYSRLNEEIRAALANGEKEIALENVLGQRYIGCGLNSGARITIDGVPGNDLAAFMNGAELIVRGNAQDGVGNTMNAGKVTIHGNAGDILGHSMRGGRIFVRGSVGYRAGIHMKEYRGRFPIVVIGGTAGDYAGEYMAGGMLVVLNIESAESPVGDYVGTGMHGGVIYLRGKVEKYQLGLEVGVATPSDEDMAALSPILAEYARDLGLNRRGRLLGSQRLELPDARSLEQRSIESSLVTRREDFTKLYPRTARPYGTLYAY